jgi:hypothetical protein
MIGAGERKNTHKREQWIVRRRPKDWRVNDLQILPGQHIIRSEITGRGIRKVSGVERRIALVCSIRAALQYRLRAA